MDLASIRLGRGISVRARTVGKVGRRKRMRRRLVVFVFLLTTAEGSMVLGNF